MKLNILSTISTLTLASAQSSISSAERGKPPEDAKCFVNADFEHGTYIISEPGSYKLCEDIIFKPNPPTEGKTAAEAFKPDYSTGYYDENAYGLGFFAAIAVATMSTST